MHTKLQERIDYIAEKFILTDYHLKRYHFFKEKYKLNEVTYILNMEWYPNDTNSEDDALNPPGTISIDIDFHTKELKNVIFVEGINQIDANLPLAGNVEASIEWVEQESGLKIDKQFKLVKSNLEELLFHATAKDIAVFPSGYIRLEFNEDGKLSVYSIHGVFPEANKIKWETFDLKRSQTEAVLKKQVAAFEVPIVDEDKWLHVYGVSTCFITNDGERVLSYEEVEADRSYTTLHKVLHWDSVEEKNFQTQDIDSSTETTLEAVLQNDKTMENQIISEDEQQKAIASVEAYLQSIKPTDTGKWVITSIRREATYLLAVLKLTIGDTRIINRKITIIMDAETFQPINHVDNSLLLDTFQELTKAKEARLTVQEAFESLYSHIEITPVYVYDRKNDNYILCGKVDCEYAVDAVTDELITIDALN